jgi:hypothetical protein
VFVFRDLQLGHLSKEQVVATIEASNMGARCFAWRKLIYDFDYTFPSERTVRVASALIPDDFLSHIIEERTCN